MTFFSAFTVEDLEQKDDKLLFHFMNSYLFRLSVSFTSNKPILKLADNSFVGLYKNHSDAKPQVYLPVEKNLNLKTLHNLFIENDSLKEFINKYKVIKPNNISELKEFICT